MHWPLIVRRVRSCEVKFAGGRGACLWLHMRTTSVVVGKQGLLVDFFIIFHVMILDVTSTMQRCITIHFTRAACKADDVRMGLLALTGHHGGW